MMRGDSEPDLGDRDKEGLLETNREGLLSDPDRLLEGLLEMYLAEPSLWLSPPRLEVALPLRDLPLGLP